MGPIWAHFGLILQTRRGQIGRWPSLGGGLGLGADTIGRVGESICAVSPVTLARRGRPQASGELVLSSKGRPLLQVGGPIRDAATFALQSRVAGEGRVWHCVTHLANRFPLDSPSSRKFGGPAGLLAVRLAGRPVEDSERKICQSRAADRDRERERWRLERRHNASGRSACSGVSAQS